MEKAIFKNGEFLDKKTNKKLNFIEGQAYELKELLEDRGLTVLLKSGEFVYGKIKNKDGNNIFFTVKLVDDLYYSVKNNRIKLSDCNCEMVESRPLNIKAEIEANHLNKIYTKIYYEIRGGSGTSSRRSFDAFSINPNLKIKLKDLIKKAP